VVRTNRGTEFGSPTQSTVGSLIDFISYQEQKTMSEQTHYLPQALSTKYREPSVAYFATAPARVLVVFVHGFGGSAHGTWPHFPELLSAMGTSKPFDAIFYHYDGKFTQANNSAALFREFIDDFVKAPTNLVNSCIPGSAKRAEFVYERVVLVAHSLGAVVVRRALLDIYHRSVKHSRRTHWLQSVILILYAPAHNGAHAAEIARSTLFQSGLSLLGLITQLIRYKTPLLADLVPNSPVLKALEGDTARALATAGPRRSQFLIPKTVVWAGDERVVINNPYLSDPVSILEVGRDHHSVCKPAAASESVFQHVSSQL
jgi:pimeloyl-ACP methyl ester carboxylesterase